jgi:hypothetical protein
MTLLINRSNSYAIGFKFAGWETSRRITGDKYLLAEAADPPRTTLSQAIRPPTFIQEALLVKEHARIRRPDNFVLVMLLKVKERVLLSRHFQTAR